MRETQGKEKTFVSVVIYVRNAENSAADFVRSVVAVLEENFEKSEIVCVDDCSDDGSVSAIRESAGAARSVCVSILHMSCFHGTEAAMSAGVDLAIGDFVFEFDSCVLDFAPEEIMRVYRKSLEGFDIVSASPENTSRVSSRVFYGIFNRSSGLHYQMTTERFRILSRRVITRIAAMNKTVPYRKPVYAASGLKSANLTYQVTARVPEKDDPLARRYRKVLAEDSLIIFTDLGYKASMLLTSLMLLFALAVGAYSVAYCLLKNPVSGWTSTILFLSASMFFMFMVLTIVLKYLQILVNLVFKKAQYQFESIEKLAGGEEAE